MRTLTMEPGTRVICLRMDDPRPIPSGTTGTVEHIDDAGQIHVVWDNNRRLALIPEVDDFRIIEEPDETGRGGK